ncbi:dihydroxyacetone phosphate acyltransferase-like isoform X2 [Gigantopelta aegis]|uniref:dihydroxyacetone phosphate acyltransferase-like isoform X2 n=1 Tax=Gigantopelta aegis TaxID=1735272 RepID=UPI001B88D78C|nr:dihydroxyacetone phosphate acyltransferase-like isoform X2 [Gigantopelta aegis]
MLKRGFVFGIKFLFSRNKRIHATGIWRHLGDDPKFVSAKQKDIFTDCLDDRRHSSDLKWSFRPIDTATSFKQVTPRTPEEIKQHVMNSDRVKYTVEQVSLEMHLPIDEVVEQASSIVDEMAHNLRMGAIRGFSFFLIKIFKQLYRRIYVNEEGIEKIRSTMKEYPILLMPTHRSYMDFLLMSYIFYSYDLPMPVIAAAMDFMGMKFFGWLLRNSGAFYIRRSFGDDQLYWAVFTEYVQTQICNGDHPIEFFVEGTRSRTSKSYPPRFGMLYASLEPYFKSHINDIMIVPASISYDRILEETLYAYELLGVPKPKESASGLLKARSILQEDFGNIHIHFGEPLSLRQYMDGKVDRSAHNLAPRYIASLTSEEQLHLQVLGHQIILQHLKNMIICPWSLVAAVLMQCNGGVSVRHIVKEVEWLKRQASNLGARIDWPGNENADAVIRASLLLHKNIVTVTSDDVVELLQMTLPATSAKQDQLMTSAAQTLLLSLYRNQLLHVFVRVAMISLSINSCPFDSIQLDDLFEKYSFLEKLLCKDFIFLPGNTKKDFDNSLAMLTHGCGVIVENNQVLIKKSVNKYTTFFSQMFEPFLLGYWIVCRYLLSMSPGVNGKPLARPPKVMAKEAQLLSAQLLRDGIIKYHEVLSLDMMNNALLALYNMGAVKKEKRQGITYKFPNMIPLSKITDDLAKFIEVPPLPSVSINVDTKTVTINAKL